MDFRSANAQPQPSHQPVPGGVTAPARGPKKEEDGSSSKWLRAGVVALFACVAILIIAVIWSLAIGGDKGSAQNKFVKSGDYQAVFLTNGQVYFGNVEAINADYIQLHDIYYLTQNTSTDSKGTTTTDGNYTLVKLGCQQIHDPIDEMVIERSQVSFWENLNSSGKVVTSIKQFQKQNPNGPDCSQVSNQTQASTNAGTQGGTGTGTNTNTTNNTTTGNKQ